jgi:hypothetical protein
MKDVLEVARDVLLSAGYNNPVICTGHEPDGMLLNGYNGIFRFNNVLEFPSEGTPLYIFPIVSLFVCKNCKCVYIK